MEIKKKTDENPLADPMLLATLAAQASTGGGAMSDDLQALLKLALKKAAKIDAQEEETERTNKVAQLSNAHVLEGVRKQRLEEQEFCNHRNEHNQSLLVGQRTQHGFAVLLCQKCQKLFTSPAQNPEERIPPGLEPRPNFVGGPHQ